MESKHGFTVLSFHFSAIAVLVACGGLEEPLLPLCSNGHIREGNEGKSINVQQRLKLDIYMMGFDAIISTRAFRKWAPFSDTGKEMAIPYPSEESSFGNVFKITIVHVKMGRAA